MTIEYLANLVNCNKNSIKTTIYRLKEKSYISISEYKDGRGGWSKYQLNEELYIDILKQEESTYSQLNGSQTVHKLNTQPNTEPNTSFSSSSSINITTTTNDKENSKNLLAGEWSEIDIEPLSEIGFTKVHLKQIAQQEKLNAEIVQESIHAFAFDIKRNDKAKKIKNSPLNFFMGILRNGCAYASPDNYESPQEEALRLYIERQEELAEKKKKQEEKLFKLHFDDWRDGLSEEQATELMPKDKPAFLYKLKSPGGEAYLANYFKENFWPVKKKEIFEQLKAY